MAEVRWTSEAQKWLREIHDFIAQDNPRAAVGVVNGILAKGLLLSDFPKAGHLLREESDGEIRVLHYGHYRIAYLTRPTNGIDVLGIFHDALDLERYLP